MLTEIVVPFKQDEVDVRDFGAIPDDGKDDSKAILAAIIHARAQLDQS